MADRKRELAELRERVASADLELLKQLEARARLSRQIHNLLEGEAPGADQAEAEWMGPLERAMSGDLSDASVRAIFRCVRAEARAIEQPVRVAFCGHVGGFGHAATLSYFGSTASAASSALVAETLELTPFGKFLFATDAYGLPELYHLGAALFRRALSEHLHAAVTEGAVAEADAVRIAELIGAGNARRVYRLP